MKKLAMKNGMGIIDLGRDGVLENCTLYGVTVIVHPADSFAEQQWKLNNNRLQMSSYNGTAIQAVEKISEKEALERRMAKQEAIENQLQEKIYPDEALAIIEAVLAGAKVTHTWEQGGKEEVYKIYPNRKLCPDCGGRKERLTLQMVRGMEKTVRVPCPTCHGTGRKP